LGEALSQMTDHYLLMTATPHKGDPDNFCLFLELLDRDVYGDVKSLEEAMKKHEAPFYLRRVPPAQLCPSLNFELMALWQKLGGGWARVMRYRDDLDGVGYVLKGLGYASQAEQNYEMRKFGSEHCHLILSNSVWRKLHRVNLGRHRTAAPLAIR
jgi:hypothetical protein